MKTGEINNKESSGKNVIVYGSVSPEYTIYNKPIVTVFYDIFVNTLVMQSPILQIHFFDQIRSKV